MHLTGQASNPECDTSQALVIKTTAYILNGTLSEAYIKCGNMV